MFFHVLDLGNHEAENVQLMIELGSNTIFTQTGMVLFSIVKSGQCNCITFINHCHSNNDGTHGEAEFLMFCGVHGVSPF